MSEMENRRLRKLVDDHYRGQTTRAQYLQSRARLLQGLHREPGGNRQPDLDTTRPHDRGNGHAQGAHGSVGPGRFGLLVALLGLGTVLLGGLVLLLLG